MIVYSYCTGWLQIGVKDLEGQKYSSYSNELCMIFIPYPKTNGSGVIDILDIFFKTPIF